MCLISSRKDSTELALIDSAVQRTELCVIPPVNKFIIDNWQV